MKKLLRVIAVLEGGMGLALLVMPSVPVELLLGRAPGSAPALVAGRIAGAVLLSLAIACWWTSYRPEDAAAAGMVKAMLFYDVAALGLLLYVRFGLGLCGVLLWPGVIVHMALSAWSIVALQRK